MNLVKHPKYKNIAVTECGKVWNTKSERFLTQTLNGNGYLTVSITETGKTARVHRVVCETFRPDCPFYGLDVNHKDGDKQNNHLSNLEWCTRSHNILHAMETGLNPSRGETNSRSVHTEETVRKACRLLEEGRRNVDVTKATGIDKSYLSEIKAGKRWGHVSKDYNLKVRRTNRYSERTIRQVCELLQAGMSPAAVSREVKSGISYKDIIRVRNKDTWKNISDEYDIPVTTTLTDSDVAIICERLSEAESVRSIVKDTRYSFDQVYKVYKRKTGVLVSCNYKF